MTGLKSEHDKEMHQKNDEQEAAINELKQEMESKIAKVKSILYFVLLLFK